VGTIIAGGVEPPQIRPAATPVGAGFVTIEAAFLPLPPEEAAPATAAPVPIDAVRSGAKVAAPRQAAPLP
jgi:rod shape-determining protein MreC